MVGFELASVEVDALAEDVELPLPLPDAFVVAVDVVVVLRLLKNPRRLGRGRSFRWHVLGE